MPLPSLDQLRLCPVGMNVSGKKQKRDFDSAPMVAKLVSDATKNVVADLANAPAMLCLQDKRASSLQAALRVLAYLKEHRDDGAGGGVSNQYDNKQDMERWEAAKERGEVLPVVAAFNNRMMAPMNAPLYKVYNRLYYLSWYLARELGAQRFFGHARTRDNNLGLTVTYTDQYGTPDSDFDFHTDMPPQGVRQHLPEYAQDWAMLTMVYYLLDSDAEEQTKHRTGQGSTLYNLQGTKRGDANTEVAFCPLKNGSITVFDGTKWHAVGPNYGIGRGAVIHKCVLHKPWNRTRQWSHGEWWRKIQQALLRMTCTHSEDFEVIRNGRTMLCDARRRPSDAAGPSDA